MTRAAVASLATAAIALALAPMTASAVSLSVTTGSPQDVTTTSATFRANVLVSALGGSVAWQYGTTTSYGAVTRSLGLSLLGVAQDVTTPVTGLAPGTTYHVRVMASGLLSTSYGQDVKFDTQKTGSGGSGSGTSGSGTSGSGTSGSGTSGSGTSGSGSGTSGSGTSGTSGSGTTSSGSGTPTKSSTTTTTTSGTTSGDDTSASAGSGDDTAAGGDGSGAVTAPGVATAEVTPVLGRTFAIATVAGKVTATAPSGAPVDLSAAAAVPPGTLIDTRGGTVELKAALDRKGTTQTARFWGGLFQANQGTGARGLTQLVLRGGNFTSCGAASTRAHASKATKKKKPPRALWGSDDHGRFETRGRGSVATVRGTRWLTEDTCDGTRTTVAAGAVAVRDLRRGKTVVVTKGHNYLARLAP
ncbi:MAG TPA: hypothetical protein VI318_01835 [Baekduia sp.]